MALEDDMLGMLEQLEAGKKQATILLLSQLWDHHMDSYNHCVQVGLKSLEASRFLGYNGGQMFFAGLLHDIGKLKVDVKILDRHVPFGEEEYRIIQSHPAEGYAKVRPLFPFEAEVLLRHHKFCKRSYPEKFPEPVNPNGFDMNLIESYARLLGVIDYYSSMQRHDGYPYPEGNKMQKIMQERSGMDEIIRRLFDANILA
ncbi:MAG TPA: HD domain-containing protein [Nanoarchaeota archaeon]|nr:HD domain-containing protein [Nanoarchaeota archaeon]